MCQLHMRHFKDGDVLWLEPWRAAAFPILRDPAVIGHCTNVGECEAACPKGIGLEVIARMNGDFLEASMKKRDEVQHSDG